MVYIIREPIVVVAGHVDHGKTSLLDYIRGSAVASKEAGRITQHIGSTEVPINSILEHSSDLLTTYGFNLKIPGLLFIDTPGHEAFKSLRERGCSVADICVLIIDIVQGVQPQTIEVISLLKACKLPFVVALTKFDNIRGFNTNLTLKEMFSEIDEGRTTFSQDFNEKMYRIVGQLGESGFTSDRFDKVKDVTKELLLIPVSSRTGHGIPELLLFLAGLSQKFLEKSLTLDVSGNGKATVLEIKDEKGFGKTIDVILYDGIIKKNDYIKIESSRGIVSSRIKMILKPKSLEDMRSTKERYENVESASAAIGLKLVLTESENVSSGDEISVISKQEFDELKNSVSSLSSKSDKGVVIKVDVQGTVEAASVLAQKNSIDVFTIDTRVIAREDVLKAKIIKDQGYPYSAILVFNQKVPVDVIEFAKISNIKIFSSDVIYKIIEDYTKWIKEEDKRIEEEILKSLIYPAEFKILSEYIFRRSQPLVCGARIEEGLLKPDAKIIQNGKVVGILKRLQDKGKDIKEAKVGLEVAISIEGTSSDKVDLTKPFYTYIPLDQRFNVKKYLYKDHGPLIDKLFDIYFKMNN